MSPNEFELIAHYFKRPSNKASVIKGIGDDCALVTLDPQHQIVMSMDTLVSGRHFPESASPAQIARRAFCTCLSDLAAMGATPQWFTLALTLPEAKADWLAEFSSALFTIADEYNCSLIGGDTTQGPLQLTLQVHGSVENNKALTRDAAEEGDCVFVSGCLGDGAAALSLLLDEQKRKAVDESDSLYLEERFYCPQPQIKTAQQLVGCANAAIDISDGLLADLQHIADASKVDIEIDVDLIPLSSACKKIAGEHQTALNFALTGGDDYQLAFTVPKQHLSQVERLVSEKKMDATLIGQVKTVSSKSAGVVCIQNGKIAPTHNKKGYQHFAS